MEAILAFRHLAEPAQAAVINHLEVIEKMLTRLGLCLVPVRRPPDSKSRAASSRPHPIDI